jgi:nicastrin
VSSEKDLDFVLNKPPAPPYVVILTPDLFTREIVMRLKNEATATNTITGIVLINKGTPTNFSQESKCPNQYSGLLKEQTCDANDAQSSWNPYGTGLMHENFPFPIYYVEDENEVKKMLDCYAEFNENDRENQASRRLCSIQINSFMSAAVNSEVCFRRGQGALASSKFCDPLQGKNVYATLHPRPKINVTERKVDETEKFILITARMDTTSMFEAVGYGAKDSLVSFATMIGVAHFLASKIQFKSTESMKNVLFVLFNGESYDYIGSQRFVYDLKNGNFPDNNTATNAITMDSIDFMIDLGTMDDLNSLIVYHAKELPTTTKLVNFLKKYNKEHDFKIDLEQIPSQNLPPVSAQSFLRENITFPAAILTSTPNNHFYHSIYDYMKNINYTYRNTSKDFTMLDDLSKSSDDFEPDSVQMKIRNVATIIGMSVYELLGGSQFDEQVGASSVLVSCC